MASSNEMKKTDPKLIEVLKRKVCLTSENSDAKRQKEEEDTNNLDLEFVEISPEDSEWMMGSSANLPTKNTAPVNSGESRKEKNLLSLISVIAAKNAMVAAEQESASVNSATESLSKNQWQVHMKAHYFTSLHEEDLISWSGEASIKEVITREETKPSKSKSKGAQQPTSNWMLNASRRICAFVHTSNIMGKSKTTYHCNFCKLTEETYGGFYQHLNHHLFACGSCAYHSSSRLDVEIHREYANHITPLSQGYMAHKQHDSLLSRCVRNSTPGESTLLEWQTIREDTEALIIIQSANFPESAKSAYRRVHDEPEDTPDENSGPVNLVCALPYHRYVSQKSCRKNVLEYHCNFCQSTPMYTQELYRHVDFHSFTCKETDCEFQSFTNLELFVHQKRCHWDKYQKYLESLVIFVPEISTKEDEYITMGMSHNTWSVVLNLPRSILPGVPHSEILKKEREWRCKICNNFVINKGGLTTHLVLLHNINTKEVQQYMEPML